MYDSIYEVERIDYVAFIRGIKSDYRIVKTTDFEDCEITEVHSKLTNKLLGARVSHKNSAPEQYYIFAIPEAEESTPVTPRTNIILETREQVQAFFNAIKKLREKKND